MTQYPRLSNMSDDDFAAYTTRVNAAMAHYHAHYNNGTYQAIQISVVRDLCGAYQAQEPKLLERALALTEVNALMNLVTDVALEASGHPDMIGRRDRLLRAILNARLSEETVHRIGEHIENFLEADSPFSTDFEYHATAALRVHTGLASVENMTTYTSDIHSKAGNAAHHMLRAAYHLLRSAELILVGEPSAAYVNEQMRSAERHMADGQQFLTQTAQSKKAEPKTEAVIQPYHTLLLSSDGTYPGIVTSVTDRIAHVTWYKWGYTGETFTDWMLLTNIADHILSVTDCQKRFGGLPPEYRS